MFYPVQVDLSDKSRVERATVVLNPAASKRLLAKAVATLPEVRSAYTGGRLAVCTSSANSFVLEELTGEKVPAYRYCVGMVADGMLTASVADDRVPPRFFEKGKKVEMEALAFFDTFEKGDAVIKGANAVDAQGNAGVLASNKQGGTIGGLLSFVVLRGVPMIMPVGLEKSVASVPDAAAGWGQLTLVKSMGLTPWLFPVTAGLVVTEIQALGILAGVNVRHIASGGLAGSEGAVVLLLEGYGENVSKAWDLVQSVKDEPRVEVPRHQYSS
ncbi:MAG: hypothetical protein A2133_00570 [Actinobacteria bacterium RBG_16_64_13]|nr:MAG: hypothetical protein A2133_00570 [Actinobacteria bacterium RBG_16_64_13]